MREIVHLQVGQCGNQIGSKVREQFAVEFGTVLMASQQPQTAKRFNVKIFSFGRLNLAKLHFHFKAATDAMKLHGLRSIQHEC